MLLSRSFICVVVAFTSVQSQTTTLISSAGDGGFETNTNWAGNGWTVVNGGTTTNRWFIGTAATGFTGARCAYIGTGSANNNYDPIVTSVAHFYRDVAIPVGQSNVTLNFNWKGYGESTFDYIRVFVVPTTTTPVAGTLLAVGQIGGDYNLASTWQSANITLPSNLAGTTQRLVFSWRNDGSVGTNPGGAIDNISLVSTSVAPGCAQLIGNGFTAVAALPYNSGAGTTCGAGNDLTANNTALCGSNLYLGGEDRVWSFTPATSGQVSIELNAPNASWTGLMLYQGCPLNSVGGSVCIAQSTTSTGSKTLCATVSANVTYYLVLDSWPSPTCNPYNYVSISAPSSGGGGPSCTSLLGTGFTNVTSLPYNSGAGTTCGAVNNLTSTNTAVCGDLFYLDGEDQVWSFTPTATGQITIDLNAPTATYTGLMLYQGCPVSGPCGSASTAICVAQSQSFTGSKSICVNVANGVTYYLVLDSWPAPACNPYTNLSISAVTTGASGTVCSNAIAIPALPYTINSQTTACAGNDYSAATPGICNGTFAAGEDRVYAFSVSTSQCIGITLTNASSNDIGFSVYQGCPGSAGSVCVGSGGGATLGSLSGTVTLPSAGNYFLIIDSQSPTSSVSYNLQVTSFGSGASNDRPFQATPLPFNITTTGNNSCSGSVDEPTGQPSCFGPIGANTLNTVWFRFVAPASGCVKIKTGAGTLINTQIAVYGPVSSPILQGSGASLPYLTCNDDLPPCGTNTYPTSSLSLIGLTPGMTYYVSVDGYASQTGSFTVFIMDSGTNGTLPLPPTPGQDCVVAFPVCDANISVPNPGPQAVGSACEFGNNINCLASGERGSYWYKVNIATNGFLEFDIVPNDWPGPPSTTATDYDFAVWKTRTAGTPGPADCNNLATIPPVACNYSALGVTGCFSANVGTAPAAYPGFGPAYQPRIAVSAGDEYLINVSNFTNSTSGFTLNFSSTSPLAANPPSGGTLVWTGSLSTDWFNPENWGGCAIPSCTYNVAIPAVTNLPAITGLNAVCGSIDISAGASITLQSNTQLKVCNNFLNNGTIIAQANSTLIMQSDSIVQNQYMTGSMTGSNRLWNVVINKPSNASGNTVFLNNDLDNAGNFTVGNSAVYAGGIFNTSGKYHRVGGNFNVFYTSSPFATYIANGSTLEFNGTTAQSYFNRGALNNVVMNHTGPGVTLGNSGVTDWMTLIGTLTLTQGKIITTASNRVNVLNNAPSSVTSGNTSSYVEGFLRRSFSPTGGAYDFPVGSAAKGYQRINFNFTGSNDRTYAIASFVNTALATPTPALGPECLYSLYDQAPLNNGYWLIDAIPSTGVAPFNTTAYPASYSNATLGYTLMRRPNTTGSWGLEGACVFPGPITAIQRTGMTTLGIGTAFAVAQSLSPLPVSLLHFKAQPKSTYINLDWSTASETNNAGFHLQRSDNGINFSNIQWIAGQGTTSSLSQYAFQDQEVEKEVTYYYRLNQIDFDGSSHFSDVVSARIQSVGVQVSAWPNPFDGSTNILLNLANDTDAEVFIVNSLGQKVVQIHKGKLDKGSYHWDFDLIKNSCRSGIYTLIVRSGEVIERLRLVAH